MNPQGQRNVTENEARDSNPAMQIREMSQGADGSYEDIDEGITNNEVLRYNGGFDVDNQALRDNEDFDEDNEVLRDNVGFDEDNEVLRDNEGFGDTGDFRQHIEDDDAIRNDGVSYSSMMEGNENVTDQEEIEQPEVDATVSPENKSIPLAKGLSQNEIQNDHETDPEPENTTQRSDSSGIRKRRHMALEGCNAASTTAAGVGPAEDGDNGIRAKKIESDTTMKKLMGGTLIVRTEEVVLAVSCRETDSRQGGGDESNCMEADYSPLREVTNEEDQKAKVKKLVARQSCIDMGYQDRRVSWAEGKFQREHGGSDDYSAVDLAKYMEERQDDVPDASHDPGPSHDPEPSHDPSTSHDLGPSHVTMATEDGQYKLTAKLTDYGCPNDGSHHVIKLEGLSMDRSHCGCNLKVIGTPSNGP